MTISTSGIARLVDQAKWKTPEQLLPERNTAAVHDPAHGQTLPVFMGAAPVEGIVFWRDGPRVETTTTTTEAPPMEDVWAGGDIGGNWAGGGGSITTTTTTRQVFVSFAVAHSFNQFQRPGELLKVEFDDVVIYDALDGTGPTSIKMRVYDGIDNGFDPTMLAKDGAALTPAYHGLRYLFFEEVDLAGFDGAIPASIRILWGDTVTSSETTGTVPLIVTDPPYDLHTTNTLLCYDRPLNRFYTFYVKDGDATGIHLGITDFSAGQEISLTELTNKPDAGIDSIWGACAIQGAGLFLCISTDSAVSEYWHLLVDAETAVVMGWVSGGVEEVQWICAQPLVGGGSRYVAAGRALFGTAYNMPVAFMEVNASSGSVSIIEPGSDAVGDGTTTHITTGFSDSAATVFYIAQRGGKVFEARFTDAAPPAYTEVYDAGAVDIWGLYYERSSDAIILSIADGSTRKARRIDPSDGSLVWETTVAGNATQGWTVMPGGGSFNSLVEHLASPATHRLRPGSALVVDRGSFLANAFLGLMDVESGSITDLGYIDTWADHFDQFTGKVYERYSPTFQHWRTLSSALLEPGTVTLADELTTFSKYDDDRGGLLTDAQVTTEGLAGIVNGGVIIDADTDLRELASRLAEVYGVVKVETATGVKWVKKATDGSYAADVVLTEADLAAERRGEAVVKIATRHRNPREVPAEIEVRYISSDADYEAMPARAAWPQGVYDTALSLLKRSLSVPVVLTDQQAAELAWGMLSRERAADRTHSIKLRPHRLKLEPSDVFELTVGGQTITGMFTKQTKGPDHSLEMVAEGYLSRAATTVAAESPIVHVQPNQSFNTLHVFLDGPLLRYGHDGGGDQIVGYSVLTGLDGWQGGSLYRLRSGESTWTKVAEIAGVNPVVGVLNAPLAASPWPFETDTENDLTFRVVYGDAGDIAAQTEAQFYEAASIIAVGAPGRWNFLTFRNKTVNADGTITLDTLRQGLRGTEVHEGTSLAGDRVVLVKAAHAPLVPYELGDVGETVEMKAVAYGVSPSAVIGKSFTVSGAAETPYAPSNFDAVINGADIDLSWIRRTRLSAPWENNGSAVEAPLGETTELYKVEILDGPGGTVLRTYTNEPLEVRTYPDADITVDFGGPPEALTYRVSQWSAVVGWGYVGEATVPLAGGGIDVLGAGGGDILGAGSGDKLGAG